MIGYFGLPLGEKAENARAPLPPPEDRVSQSTLIGRLDDWPPFVRPMSLRERKEPKMVEKSGLQFYEPAADVHPRR